jgi:acyl-CoA thioesterase FadM
MSLLACPLDRPFPQPLSGCHGNRAGLHATETQRVSTPRRETQPQSRRVTMDPMSWNLAGCSDGKHIPPWPWAIQHARPMDSSSFTQLRRTVRFGDTDAAGVMHFHQLLRWSHEAYEESLERYGLDLAAIFPSGDLAPAVALPIVHCSADYRAPLVCGQRIIISLSPERLDPSSFAIQFSLAIWRSSASAVAAARCRSRSSAGWRPPAWGRACAPSRPVPPDPDQCRQLQGHETQQGCRQGPEANLQRAGQTDTGQGRKHKRQQLGLQNHSRRPTM